MGKLNAGQSINIPWKVSGSSVFGRYPKISLEETWNMIISDEWLVPFAGYSISSVTNGLIGRGNFSSEKGGFMISVIDNGVYKSISDVNGNLITTKIDLISTYSGDVFIIENNNSQIAICDKLNIYVYNYLTSTFSIAYTGSSTMLDFTPIYITYQNTRIIAIAADGQWRLSLPGDATQFPAGAQYVGEFQTGGDDLPLCAFPMPGKGNMLIILGSNVGEIWYDMGLQLFPYQKDIYNNLGYGCANQASLATLGDIAVWIAGNKKSGYTIMYTTGAGIQQISTDGINFKIASLNNPKDCYAFLFKQDGHVIYLATFYNDNISLIHDFNTAKFFNVSNEHFNYHIAKQITFYNNKYYFVSNIDGNLYEMSSTIYDYNGQEIPRVRITENVVWKNEVGQADQSRFICNNASFTMMQGESSSIQVCDYRISYDGGFNFSSDKRITLKPLGNRQNLFIAYNLGMSNSITSQIRFYGNGPFVASDGVFNIYQ